MGVAKKKSPGTASFRTRISRQRRTCEECAKAKRKCDKTAPSCLRCFERGIRCTYPPRRSSFISFGGDQTAFKAVDDGPEEEVETGGAVIAFSLTEIQTPGLPRAPRISHTPSAGTDVTAGCRWFLTPESWARHHGTSAPQGEVMVDQKSLPTFIDRLQEWAGAWVRNGSSPMMHRQLYQHGMPECIEDAYTSLAAYNAAFPSIKPTTLRVIQNRVDKLLSQTQASDDAEDLEGISSACLLDTPTHLARTQALFIYQLIRLFDGDIRARAQAEGDMGTLSTWCRQMLESAQLDCAAAEFFAAGGGGETNPFYLPTTTATTTTPSGSPQIPPPQPLWRAWLRSESLRRTYLAATLMQAVYDTLKQGWALCPGGIFFTAQSGLWEARSGYEWVAALRAGARARCQGRGQGRLGGGPGRGGDVEAAAAPWVMVQFLESWRILEAGVPGEVDDFAVALLEVGFGGESVERWRFERGDDH
ncbi:hypothetical protein C8A01DRAFT_43248 [Parachaetomium inaequale]|uniref:Zn(2)-C6 fungal-type domain-containing protein n=1 Tax=Parachaetomium inaequale TaxID=2588326 RepID=A0AAN6PRD0_9PEZI|nr:hypothetical protein C8A01DRAFT_43248 [Parachaetomium inaequale]